jgi:transcriptional regulator with XRE-family HTH domain
MNKTFKSESDCAKIYLILLIIRRKFMSNASLGERILNSRKAKGITIREFAKQTGLSISILSQIERGIANPSLNSLRAIAEALNIPLSSLFINEIDHESLLLRKGNRKKVYRENSDHIVFDILTPEHMKSNVEILWMTLNPNSETTSGYMEHNKEEFAVVMKGNVYVILEDKEYLLNEGDTVRILPRMKHKFRNKSNSHIEVLFILSLSIF